MENNDFIQYERDGYGFRNFFNAGLDKMTGVCDGEGVDIYDIDDQGEAHFVAMVYGVFVSDIYDMTDSEFDNFLAENGVF